MLSFSVSDRKILDYVTGYITVSVTKQNKENLNPIGKWLSFKDPNAQYNTTVRCLSLVLGGRLLFTEGVQL